MIHTNKKLIVFITLFVILVMGIAGLKPKGFRMLNTAKLYSETNGLYFNERGIAFTQERLNVPRDSLKSITIEMHLTLPDHNIDRLQTLASFWDKNHNSVFQINQWRNYLAFEKITFSFWNDKKHEISTRVPMGEKIVLTVVSQVHTGTMVYINGVMMKKSEHFVVMNCDEVLGQLILGNSSIGTSPFSGALFSILIHQKCLLPHEIRARAESLLLNDSLPLLPETKFMYTFDERSGNSSYNKIGNYGHVFIPTFFQIPQKQFLTMPWKAYSFDLDSVADDIINLTGFVPFGFFFSLFLCLVLNKTGRSILYLTLVSGFLFSFTIEFFQIFMPTRCSQFSDLFLNTLGTLIGYFLSEKKDFFVRKFFVRHNPIIEIKKAR